MSAFVCARNNRKTILKNFNSMNSNFTITYIKFCFKATRNLVYGNESIHVQVAINSSNIIINDIKSIENIN